MPQPVTTPHGPANELIGRLRECAADAKRLGDENERLQRELADKREQLADEREHYHRARSEQEAATGTLTDWAAVLEDFRSGIRDADELLERTVGRR